MVFESHWMAVPSGSAPRRGTGASPASAVGRFLSLVAGQQGFRGSHAFAVLACISTGLNIAVCALAVVALFG